MIKCWPCMIYFVLAVVVTGAKFITVFQSIHHLNEVRRSHTVSRSLQAKPSLARISSSDFGNNENISDSNPDLSAEEDYRKKLAEADRAIAEAQKARLALQRGHGPPPGTTSRIEYTDAGTLIITTPRPGLNTGSVFAGAFSLAWFSSIVPATLSGGGLFMVPFWLAGGIVAKQAVVDPFVASELSIGKFAWSLRKTYAGRGLKKTEGSTEELRGAKVEVVAIVNDVPQAEVKLYCEKGVTGFGLGLGGDELEYLAEEINYQLLKKKSLDNDDF